MGSLPAGDRNYRIRIILRSRWNAGNVHGHPRPRQRQRLLRPASRDHLQVNSRKTDKEPS